MKLMMENEENRTKCSYFDYYDGPDGRKDTVNHPVYYAESCSLECIEVMKCCFGVSAVYGFCLCNAFKYLWRYKFKNGDEDLKKAKWYIDKAYILAGKYEEIGDSDMHERVEELYFEVKEKEKSQTKKEVK